MRRCVECGCVEAAACVGRGLLGELVACSWAAEDLCTACEEERWFPNLGQWHHPARSITDRLAAVEVTR